MLQNQENNTIITNDESLIDMLQTTKDTNNLEALFVNLPPFDQGESFVRRC